VRWQRSRREVGRETRSETIRARSIARAGPLDGRIDNARPRGSSTCHPSSSGAARRLPKTAGQIAERSRSVRARDAERRELTDRVRLRVRARSAKRGRAHGTNTHASHRFIFHRYIILSSRFSASTSRCRRSDALLSARCTARGARKRNSIGEVDAKPRLRWANLANGGSFCLVSLP